MGRSFGSYYLNEPRTTAARHRDPVTGMDHAEAFLSERVGVQVDVDHRTGEHSVGSRLGMSPGRGLRLRASNAGAISHARDDRILVGNVGVLERRAVGDWRLLGGDDPGVIEVVQALLGDHSE
jgi:hypothetical protein